MKALVIYHGTDCIDGFTAAWVVWRNLKKMGFLPQGDFVEGVYGKPPPDVRDRAVFIVDFSYPRDVMEKLIAEGLDVSQVAKLFGGGGHKHAAGFQEPIPR